ncbi:carbohydrate kinase family protein [Streptomyces sp. NPDC059455]|uniref:carbohydrate kinase family protein n=1 Tax=Streptomyces sp. NPDC059455 TaxID=3346837 RepID=UPI0036A85E02
MSSSRTRSVVSFGAYILDCLVAPVSRIPDGQGGELVDEIVLSPAGPAGGTALVLAKLGMKVRSAGCVGTDASGTLLMSLLEEAGADVANMRRIDGATTSASVLPIRPDGSRPALHVIGANTALKDAVPWDAIREADHLHLGGPEFLGPEEAARVLAFARAHGATTSVDSIAASSPEGFALFADALPLVDYLLPNDEQALGWTGADSVAEAARRLYARGAAAVIVTAGADPTMIVDARGERTAPVFDVDVVDTSGCGDSFSAGFLAAVLQHGASPDEAAVIGAATAAHVASGLGTSYGRYTFASITDFAASAARKKEAVAHGGS